ncbi:MFS transporter [Sphingomonas sp. AP4-R1]|uniref:spinster family MFS transporter n=1 Tax=Sphingomonas sp. AP4-R1 TaxID=2735134 RepID=UPI001493903C|nr:MFS transporter [Sphingomonas sp. AP4-R1]QJU59870.1 MFS transporter [Sphingomonas sp. AP4-R1]
MTERTASSNSNAYRWYALGVLILAYVLAFVDRQILNLLVQPIKRDLGLSDIEISLLQGLSFALFLSVGGLPIGRLIDTRPRTRLLGVGVAVWSLASAGCGLARGYGQLLLCRIGVGVGEATMTPSAYSLIGDYFPVRRQGLAMGLYSVGAYVGAGLALVIGAAVASRVPAEAVVPLVGTMHGWQLVFLLVGAPGLLVALWVASLREPVRSGAQPHVSLREALAWFRVRSRPLILVNLGVAFAAMAMYGLSAWAATFFLRRYGMTAADAGRTLGFIVMAAGGTGTLAAGLLGDRLTAAGRSDGRLRVMIAGAMLAMPFAVAAPLAGSAPLSFALLVPTFLFLTLAIGSGPATLQQITPSRMRGMQHALAVLAVNLIGLGLGPTAVALLTDRLLHDEARLGEALAIALPVALAVSCLCGLAARAPYRRAVADVA